MQRLESRTSWKSSSTVNRNYMRQDVKVSKTKILDTEDEKLIKKQDKHKEGDDEKVSYIPDKDNVSQSKIHFEDDNLENYTDEQKRVFVKNQIDKRLLLKGYEIVYPPGLIPIRSSKNFIWNIILLTAILGDYLLVPFELCSMESEYINHTNIILLNVIQLIYILDVVVKFRKTYYNEDNDEIVSSYNISYRYFNSMNFFIDAFAMVPFTQTTDIYFKAKGYPTMILLLRLLKIKDMPRIYIEFYEYLYIPKWVNFMFYLFAFMYIIHIETCLWYAMIMFEYYRWDQMPEGDFKEKEKELIWLPPTYRNIETDDSLVDLFYKGSVFHKYSYLFYQISYVVKGNEIGPITLMQNVLAALFVFLGLLVMGVVFGEIASSIEELNQEKTEFSNLIDDTHVKLSNNKISSVLSKKVMIYLDYAYHKELLFKEEENFQDLSESLQKDLVFYRHQSIIANVPIFADLDPIEIHAIIRKLKTWIYMPGDNITTKGEKGNEMFFIIEGSAEVIIDKGSFLEGRKRVTLTLPQGSFFGEIALISNSKRTADVNANDFCIMEILTKADYDELLVEFPTMRKKLKSGIKRMKVSSLKQIIDAFKRNPMFSEFKEEDLKNLVKSYVEITYVDPQTVITRPTKRCRAFYMILVGTVARYDCSKQSINFIKQMNRTKQGAKAKNSTSYDEDIENLEKEEQIQSINPLEIMQRGRWLGSMPCGRTQRNLFFDVADSAVQLAVLTTRSISEMMTSDPQIYDQLTKAYLKHVEPEKKKETLNLMIPNISIDMSRQMDDTNDNNVMSGIQSPCAETITHSKRILPQQKNEERNDAQMKEQLASINQKLNILMKKYGKSDAYKKLQQTQLKNNGGPLTFSKDNRTGKSDFIERKPKNDQNYFKSVHKEKDDKHYQPFTFQNHATNEKSLELHTNKQDSPDIDIDAVRLKEKMSNRASIELSENNGLADFDKSQDKSQDKSMDRNLDKSQENSSNQEPLQISFE